jgi:dihydroneopterin aldolase
LNYAEVYAVVETEMQKPSCLLENVAYRIAQRLFRDFPRIRSIRLEVAKQNPPMGTCGGQAAVEIQLNNDKSQ